MFSGIFTVEERHHTLNICPRHRADFGIRCSVCEDLGLDIPLPPVRKKAP